MDNSEESSNQFKHWLEIGGGCKKRVLKKGMAKTKLQAENKEL